MSHRENRGLHDGNKNKIESWWSKTSIVIDIRSVKLCIIRKKKL